ncbi:MAG: hypothetical protein LBC71_03710 [Oscillospiraceae bacterium]|jgi:hypothetical protein|nr:hypothetical protein [Oscillospiraceae bacterium]
MFCPKCGKEVAAGGFCGQCGAAVNNDTPQQPQAVPVMPPPPPPPPPMQPPPQYAPVAQQPPPPHGAPPPPPYGAPPPPYGTPPPYHAHPMAQPGFIGDVFSKAFAFLFKKPVLLWGISLLCVLMTFLVFAFGVIPLITLPVSLVLQLGMINVFLKAFRGQEISATQLFEGFGKGKFLRNAGGMAWRELWIIIWSMLFVIPGIVKSYSYRLTPYIMIEDADIEATEALKKSMRLTKGYRGKMFLTDIIIGICIGAAVFIPSLLIGMVPILAVILGPVLLVVFALAPILLGTVEAIYYEKISKENEIPK